MHKQGRAQIPVMSWIVPLLISSVAASAFLLEQFMIVPAVSRWLQWVMRLGLVLIVFLVSWFVFRRHQMKAAMRRSVADSRSNTMKSIVKITVDIVSELEEAKVLLNIAQTAADLISAPFGCLFLYNESEDELRLVAQTPYHFNLVGKAFEKHHGVTGVVLETGQPYVVNKYSEWVNRIPYDLSPLDTFVGIPLIWKGETIGTLSIGDISTNRTFGEEDIQLLQPFADLAAIAIINSRMYGKEKQRISELSQLDREKSTQLAYTREELIQKTLQLQGLIKRLTNIQESERARISHDMHDSTTQLILAAVYGTQAVMDGMETNPDQARVQLKTVQMVLHQIEIEIREAIRNLRPIILDQEGTPVALRQYVERVTTLANMKYTFKVTGAPVRLPEEFEVAIYRIVQEAIQNITAHAHASKIDLGIQFLEDRVVLTVVDDGVGFNFPEEFHPDGIHFGLAGMRERAEAIGATFQLSSQPGQGTCVQLGVPYSLKQVHGEG